MLMLEDEYGCDIRNLEVKNDTHIRICLPEYRRTRSQDRCGCDDKNEDVVFVPFVEVPGAVYFYKRPEEPVASDLLTVIMQGWPMLVLILLGAGYSGIIIWLLVRLVSKELPRFTVSQSFFLTERYKWLMNK